MSKDANLGLGVGDEVLVDDAATDPVPLGLLFLDEVPRAAQELLHAGLQRGLLSPGQVQKTVSPDFRLPVLHASKEVFVGFIDILCPTRCHPDRLGGFHFGLSPSGRSEERGVVGKTEPADNGFRVGMKEKRFIIYLKPHTPKQTNKIPGNPLKEMINMQPFFE